MSDEAILAAIEGIAIRQDDNALEGTRRLNAEGHNHNHSESTILQQEAHLTKKESRIVKDNNTRQSLGIGGAMTGPKGVLADYRFHQRQEKARMAEKDRQEAAKLSATAMKSGWIEREIQREEREKLGLDKDEEEIGDDEEDALDRLLEKYRMKRLQEMAAVNSRPRFGTFTEMEVDQYVTTVEGPGSNPYDEKTTVVVHLFQPSHDACRLVNAFLAVLAPKYPFTKFVRIVSTKTGDFDEVALPALLVYRGGELALTLLRVDDEIEGWKGGRCGVDDFEEYLVRRRVVDADDMVDGDDMSGDIFGYESGRSKLSIRAAINSLAADGN
ncbi:thioredoxin-like protein [Chytridium lagenaria]|nr:thioredoxin-like protein [Chytridium lagenaria]